MDMHFATAAYEQNVPVPAGPDRLRGATELPWCRVQLSCCTISTCTASRHFQQGNRESKCARGTATATVDGQTGPITGGELAPTASTLLPADPSGHQADPQTSLGRAISHNPTGDHHPKLLANPCPRLNTSGQEQGSGGAEFLAAGKTLEQVKDLVPFKVFEQPPDQLHPVQA